MLGFVEVACGASGSRDPPVSMTMKGIPWKPPCRMWTCRRTEKRVPRTSHRLQPRVTQHLVHVGPL